MPATTGRGGRAGLTPAGVTVAARLLEQDGVTVVVHQDTVLGEQAPVAVRTLLGRHHPDKAVAEHARKVLAKHRSCAEGRTPFPR